MLNRALIGKVGYLSCQDEWKELQLLSAECLYFYGMLYVSLIWKRAVPGSATVLLLNTGIPSLSLVETASSLTHSVQPKQCRKVFPFSTQPVQVLLYLRLQLVRGRRCMDVHCTPLSRSTLQLQTSSLCFVETCCYSLGIQHYICQRKKILSNSLENSG